MTADGRVGGPGVVGINGDNAMKRSVVTVMLTGLVCAAWPAWAQPVFERPGLVTSVGQSSDIAIVKVVLNTQAKLGLDVKPLAQVADLDGMKTLVIVVGASTKGLGAAGLDVQKEVARAGTLMKAAREKGIRILAVHTGGEARRGKTSNDVIEAVVPDADYVIVVAAGNKDKRFDALAAPRSTPVVEIEKVTALADQVKALFK
jgi:hypothetical protein